MTLQLSLRSENVKRVLSTLLEAKTGNEIDLSLKNSRGSQWSNGFGEPKVAVTRHKSRITSTKRNL